MPYHQQLHARRSHSCQGADIRRASIPHRSLLSLDRVFQTNGRLTSRTFSVENRLTCPVFLLYHR